MLVFDAHDKLSFEETMRISGWLEPFTTAEVRLAVGVMHATSGATSSATEAMPSTLPSDMGAWASRCRAHGFEMVLVANTDGETVDENVLGERVQRMLREGTRGKESEELDVLLDCFAGGTGFQRVVDALQIQRGHGEIADDAVEAPQVTNMERSLMTPTPWRGPGSPVSSGAPPAAVQFWRL